MMLSFNEVVNAIESLHDQDLNTWIRDGWVLPSGNTKNYQFSEIDVARIQLISELFYECDFDAEAMPVVLNLLDQIYGLRRQLNTLTRAIEVQPTEIRIKISQALTESGRQSPQT
jgi:chaperone modulatory protein CbpM